MGDHTGEMGEQRGEMKMLLGPQTKNKLEKSSEGVQELLPGIPDSITLTDIAPKLPWRAVRILSLVSAAWQRAVHSREVYKARICAGSTATVVVRCHSTLPLFMPREDRYFEYVYALSVYSVEDKRRYQLPPIPSMKRGIPGSRKCVSLDAKLYILGGKVELYGDNSAYKEVYELDLAGKWEWKRCADMQHGRLLFACSVMNERRSNDSPFICPIQL